MWLGMAFDPISCQMHLYRFKCRVSSDLENLENLEMSRNFDARRKSQGKVREFKKKQRKSGKSRGILLCEIQLQPV